MNKKYALVMAALAALAMIATACAPTSGKPVAASADSARAAAESDIQVENNNDAMKNQGLEGTRWILASYRNAAGEMVDILVDTEPTLEFGQDGQLGGNGSCNRYFASYTVEGDKLIIGPAGSTLMACEPPERMQQEVDFLAALANAATFIADGEKLEIYDTDGAILLVFQASQSASLAGTKWTATMVNNGREAVTSTLEGTTITAVFAEDGRLNGSAGCNNYMTNYTVDGQAIIIDPPATTRKLCPEPEGVMDQEAAFTMLLPQAATYSISNGVLELRTAEGALIVSFTATN